MFPFIVAVLTIIILLLLLPKSQELIHWLIPVSIHVSISEFGVYYVVSLAIP